MRKLACIAGAALIVASLTGCGNPNNGSPYKDERTVTVTDERIITLIPCPTEDSDNCYWDAETMGNGQGTSYVSIDGVLYFPEMR